jgi:hypothetical protein
MRDTRWVFYFSRGWGAGMLKMADFRVPLISGGTLRRGSSVFLVFVSFAHAIGITVR